MATQQQHAPNGSNRGSASGRNGDSKHTNGSGNPSQPRSNPDPDASHRGNFWQRLGGMFHSKSAVPAVDSAASEAADRGASLAPTRVNRRELTQSYDKLVGLMDAMRDHFGQQDQRAQQLTQSVDKVAGILTQLAEHQQSQGEAIRGLTDQLVTSKQHQQQMSETLSQLPASLSTQAESVRSLMRQIEAGQANDARFADTLSEFGQAVNSLRASSASQVDTLRALHQDGSQQRETLTTLVNNQGKRYLFMTVAVSVVALAALGTMVTALLMLSK